MNWENSSIYSSNEFKKICKEYYQIIDLKNLNEEDIDLFISRNRNRITHELKVFLTIKIVESKKIQDIFSAEKWSILLNEVEKEAFHLQASDYLQKKLKSKKVSAESTLDEMKKSNIELTQGALLLTQKWFSKINNSNVKCWRCKNPIMNKNRCPNCRWKICDLCGACSSDCTEKNRIIL